MRIFDLYKEASGQKVYLARIIAVTSDAVLYNMRELPEREHYLPPEECTDPQVYKDQIKAAQSKADVATDPSICGMWQMSVLGLKETLAKLEGDA